MALDPRHLAKPGKFEGRQENQHPEWMSHIGAYMTLAEVGYGRLPEDFPAEAAEYRTLPTDLKLKKAAVMLHAVCSATPSGGAVRICHEAMNQVGREALRRLRL